MGFEDAADAMGQLPQFAVLVGPIAIASGEFARLLEQFAIFLEQLDVENALAALRHGVPKPPEHKLKERQRDWGLLRLGRPRQRVFRLRSAQPPKKVAGKTL